MKKQLGVLQKKEYFYVLPPVNDDNKHHPIIIFNNNKYYHNASTSNRVYWICCKCKHRLTTDNNISELIPANRLLSKDVHIEQLLNYKHPHEDTWTISSHRETVCYRILENSMHDIDKARKAWNNFDLLYPTISSITFNKYTSIKNTLHRYHRVYNTKLPQNFTQCINILSDPHNKEAFNYWGKSKFVTDQYVINNNVKETTDVTGSIMQLNREIYQLKQQKKYLENKLIIQTAPWYYFSTILWNSSEEHQIIIIATWHGALRLCSPNTTYYTKKNNSRTILVDGTRQVPLLSPISDKRRPWFQLLQMHALIEAPNVEYRSKSFASMFAFLPSKKGETYSKLLHLIEEGYKKRHIDTIDALYKKFQSTNHTNYNMYTDVLQQQNTNKKANQLRSDNTNTDRMYTVTQHNTKKRNLQIQNENLNYNKRFKLDDSFPSIHSLTEKYNQLSIKHQYCKTFKFDSIHIDFEYQLINAFRQYFSTNLHITGCFFHFTQANFHKLATLGLREYYRNHQGFRVYILHIVLAAFLPSDEIYTYFMSLKKNISIRQFHGKLLAIRAYIIYFENTWLQRYNPKIWSVWFKQNRTNNLLERSNRQLKEQFGRLAHFF